MGHLDFLVGGVGGGGEDRDSFFFSFFFFFFGGGGGVQGGGGGGAQAAGEEEDIRASLFQSGLSSLPGFFITLAPSCTSFNPLNLMRDQDRISPYNIYTISTR